VALYNILIQFGIYVKAERPIKLSLWNQAGKYLSDMFPRIMF